MRSFKGMLHYPRFWQKKSSILSCVLYPLSWVFRIATLIRNSCTTPSQLGGFVICVGNATVGGTGKTQIIKWLAKYCTEERLNFVIISKGFGGKSNKPIIVDSERHTAIDVGDEALEMRECGVVISAKNILDTIPMLKQIKTDSFAGRKFSSDKFIILVDDGMQNPNFVKDMTIMVVDLSRGFGNGRIIPAGPLREHPLDAINRSDVIVFVDSLTNDLSNTNKAFIDKCLDDAASLERCSKNTKEIYILKANIKFQSPESFKEQQYIAFAGIGNPQRFFNMLQMYGIKTIDEFVFPDHHNYKISELNNLCSIARKKGAKLITTKKDFVRLRHFIDQVNLDSFRVIDALIDFSNDEARLRNFLSQKID